MSDPIPPQPLSARQNDVMNFIRRYRGRTGISPTINEIAVAMGISTTSTHEHLQTLVNKGHLVKRPGISRGFVPAEAPKVDLAGAVGVVDDAFKGKAPESAVGDLQSQITSGLKALPVSN